MSYLPMPDFADGRSSYGLDRLSLSGTSDIDDFQGGFRSYHHSEEEESEQKIFGTAGGGAAGGSTYQYPQSTDNQPSPFSSDDAPYMPQRRLTASGFEGQPMLAPHQLYIPAPSPGSQELQGDIDSLAASFAYDPMQMGSSMGQEFYPSQYETNTLQSNWGLNMAASSQHPVAGPSRDSSHYLYSGHSDMTVGQHVGGGSTSSSSSGYESYTHYHDLDLPSDPETEEYLRRFHNIPPEVPINLNALPDPPSGKRPTPKLASLVQLAIWGSPRKKLTLQEIYAAIENRYTYYKSSGDAKWKGSIRHMLSLKSMFVASSRPVTEPGKGNYWMLDVSGAGKDKRARKRRDRSRHTKHTESTDSQDDDGQISSPGRESQESQVSPTDHTQRIPKRARSLPYPPSSSSATMSPPHVGLSQQARRISRASSPATSDSSGPSASRSATSSTWGTAPSSSRYQLGVEGQPPFRQGSYGSTVRLNSMPPSMETFSSQGYPLQGSLHTVSPHLPPNVISLPPSSREGSIMRPVPIPYPPIRVSAQSQAGSSSSTGFPATGRATPSQSQSARMQPRRRAPPHSASLPAPVTSSGDQSQEQRGIAPEMLTRPMTDSKGKGRTL